MSKIQEGSSQIDPNSEAYAEYTNIIKKFDPLHNNWVNC